MTSWQVWWEMNNDPYMIRKRKRTVGDALRRSDVLPSLKKALDQTSDPDINSACLIAIGKAGVDHPDFKILDVIRKSLPRGNIEIREAAVLALGISGMPEAVLDLDALIRNTKRGCALIRRKNVGDRLRSFAAYSLGLLAHRTDSGDLKTLAFESLVTVLEDKKVRDRDVLTAVLNGIRLINPDPAKGAVHKRLLWRCIAALEEFQARRFKNNLQGVQAHVTTALAALVGRGDGVEQQRAKKLVVSVIKKKRKAGDMVYRSATIALGEMLLPEESSAADKLFMKDLAHMLRRTGDRLTPRLGMIAFGKVGGETNFKRLATAIKRSRREVKPWVALGLGLLARGAGATTASKVDNQKAFDAPGAVGKLLHANLLKGRNRDLQAAIAIGLGLAGYKKAAPDLRKLLERYMQIEEFAGHLCVSLALLDDTASISLIQKAMARGDHSSPRGHAALALARLNQQGVSAVLLGTLQSRGHGPWQVQRLAAAAKALGYLRNPDDVLVLSRMVAGSRGARGSRSSRLTRGTNLARAFAAVALGAIADQDPLGFGARVANGMNYTVNIQTVSNGRNGILDIL